MGRQSRRLILVLAFIFSPLPGFADELGHTRDVIARRLQETDVTGGYHGPYCGVYAAVRALSILGVTADIKQVITDTYISSHAGSTPADLIKLIESYGQVAQPCVNLCALDVRLLDDPIIANVRSSRSGIPYDHWVCLLSGKNGFLVFDGANKPVEFSASEFLALWNGYGLVVSRPGNSAIWALWLARFVTVFIGVAGTAWLHRVLRSKNLIPKTSLCSIFFCAAVGAIFANAVFEDLRSFNQGMRDAMVGYQIEKPEMSTLEQLVAASRDGGAILVDARYGRDYCLGTIPSALNIPVDSSYIALTQVLAEIPLDTPFLVFCQSESCGYDDVVAERLRSMKFQNVSAASAGWKEYVNFVAQAK